jgi:UDP-N-acetylglucosamine--N-acetylmuramyl-(pentapeptide) pyrophosphoryl-undecaprenol N-acetylglucosamine transferase
MKIVFTGGGSGGHFYPIIAIAEAIQDLVREEQLVEPQLYYLAPSSFDEKALFENGIAFMRVPAGKMRRYASVLNFTDLFVTLYGTIVAIFKLFRLYPDAVVSKGGYASVPVVLAAALFRIPLIIHESDAKPGRANLLAAKFADHIAISFEGAAAHFPENVRSKIARTGIPVRKALMRTESEGARQYLGLEPSLPTVLVLGGSQGAARINEAVITALPDLVAFANIIHQTGQAHYTSVEAVAKVVLDKNQHAGRYHPVNYMTEISLQRAAGAANAVVSRAGANSIAEIGLWRKPAILIPIPESISHDQRSNAYAYSESGAGVVIEEENLTPHLLVSEIKRILGDTELKARIEKGPSFTDPDAARVLAKQVLAIGLSHES